MFCRVSPPFQTEVKLSALYPLPWDVQVSATIQSIPGTPIVATAVVASPQIAPSLGRDLAAGAATTATIQLVEPGTMYGDRLNQVDVRVTKSIRLGRATLRALADVYNLFNVSPVLNLNQRFGPAWQTPFIILPGRFLKLGVQVDF
jgi:outer membrane receptor protein involved in Fe transport